MFEPLCSVIGVGAAGRGSGLFAHLVWGWWSGGL